MNIKIDPIIFNNRKICSIKIQEVALKHHHKASDFCDIAAKLNGQNREPDEIDACGHKIYKLASCTSLCSWRDTMFREDSEGLVFFHGSPRRKKQYEGYPEKFKKRF